MTTTATLRPTRLVAALTALATGLLLVLAPSADAAGRERWDTRVFAKVQSPGYPAYVFVHRNGRVYAGTYTNPTGDTQHSIVREWTPDGTLTRSWTVRHQDLDEDHGVQVANQTSDGRLVLLEKSTASVILLNLRTGGQKVVAHLPDLPACQPPTQPAPGCSPNVSDEKPIPNYASWGPGGHLYVTDYAQAVIWRIPRRGGKPRVWFASPQLDGTEFGTTGIVWRPGRRDFLISQQSTAADLSLPTNGKLYRLPVTKTGKPKTLSTLWTSQPTELPDGFGIARSGRIYIAMAGPTAQLVVLSPSGGELERFPEAPGGENGSEVPFDTPSNATFLGKRVLVANQAFLGDGSNHAILDVYVGERGRRPFLPRRALLR